MKLRVCLALIGGLSVLAQQGSAQIPVGGHITTNTTWNDPTNRYVISSNTWVDTGVTLTISPGVEVTNAAGHYLYVDGALYVDGGPSQTQKVHFGGRYNRIAINSGGLAELRHCRISGDSSSLTFAEGARGTVENAQGTNGWSVTLNSSNAVLMDSVLKDLTLNASALVSNCVINVVTVTNVAPVVVGNSITNATPLKITDPDAVLAGFTNNTYATNAKVAISGTLNGMQVLGPVETLWRYILGASLVVTQGAVLEVQSDLEFEDALNGPDLQVWGSLVAAGVLFSGTYNSPEVKTGGWACLTNCAFSRNGSLTFDAGSGGVLAGVQGTNGWNVTLNSSNVVLMDSVLKDLTLNASALVSNCVINVVTVTNVAPVVVGNLITNATPLKITDPDAVLDGFSNNTYTANAKAMISGTLEGMRGLASLGTLRRYSLAANLVVTQGAVLEMQSDLEFEDAVNGADLEVWGELMASGVTFSGAYNQPEIKAGGRAVLTNCVFTGTLSALTFLAGSSGGLENVTGTNGWDLTIQSSDVRVTGGLAVDLLTISSPLVLPPGIRAKTCTLSAEVGLTNAVIGTLNLSVSAVVVGCTLGQVSLSGGTPLVVNNQITNATPLTITQPDVVPVGFSNNTYTAPNARVSISGIVKGALGLGPVETLQHYYLGASLVVTQGAVLEIQPGIELEDGLNGPDLEVYGELAASGVLFSGINNHPEVKAGGQAYLTNCVFSGSSSVTFAAGSEGVLAGVQGTNGWNVTLSSSDVVLIDSVLKDLTLYASAWVSNCVISTVTLTNVAPIVAHNLITNTTPLKITDPDAVLAGFSNNTYLAGTNAKVAISGTLNGTLLLRPVEEVLWRYFLPGLSLVVAPGAALVIPAGIEFEDGSNGPDLEISGLLVANGVLFSGSYNAPDIKAGGNAWLTNSAFSRNGSISFATGSGGALVGVQGTNGWNVTLGSSDVVLMDSVLKDLALNASALVSNCVLSVVTLSNVAPVVVHNLITNATPIKILDPDAILTGFSGNTYPAPDAKVEISGTLNETRVLGPVESLWHYYLFPRFVPPGVSLIVAPGSALHVQPGVELESTIASFASLEVSGLLVANGVLFSGATNRLEIKAGGQACLTNCLSSETGFALVYAVGGSGSVVRSMPRLLSVHSGANCTVTLNDFSLATVVATGSPSATILMDYNWWGTTNPAEIEQKIIDHRRDVSRPLIDYEPFLQASPLGPPTIVLQPQNQSVAEGSEASFSVLAGGGAPLFFQWFLNGTTPVADATQPTLILRKVQPSAAGDYTVVVSNALGSLTSDPATLTVIPRPIANYEWPFSQGNLDPALGDGVMEYADGPVTQGLTSFRITDGVSVPHIDGQLASTMHVPAFVNSSNGYLLTLSSSGPNGGGVFINQYTLILDVLIPGPLAWTPFFNTNPSNFNDADLYLAPDGSVGVGQLGYSPPGAVQADTWHRIAFTADLGAGTVSLYVNGGLVHERTGASLLDSRFSLYSSANHGADLFLFNEGNASGVYTHELYLSSFFFTDRTMSAAEIAALGGPKAPGIMVQDEEMSVPTITQQPASQTSLAGEAAFFTVGAVGRPEPTCQWRWNGIPIPGATNDLLTLANVQPPAAGDYTVVVSNPLGHVTSAPATLAVQLAPVFTQQPISQQAPAGASVTFSAQASGIPDPAYQWQWNGLAIPAATNHSLVLSGVDLAQAGAYSVLVSNALGMASSVEAFLTVLLAPQITGHPATTNVQLGSAVTFCVTASGSDPFRYQWRKNGANIPGATNACYSIASVALADGGSYTAAVANDGGTATSDPALLNIQVTLLPPGDNFADRVALQTNEIRGSNLGTTKEAGEPDHAGQPGGRSVWYARQAETDGIVTVRTSGSEFDTLLAVYTGDDVAHLQWVAADEDQGGYFSSALQFNATAGTAYSIAVDGFDGASGAFVLSWELEPTPDPLPIITQQPASQTVAWGSNATFTVTVAGQGLSYQWFFNGAPLSNALGPELTLPDVQPTKVGFYTVRITNSAQRWLESLPAVLEIGHVPGVQSLDKISYATPAELTGGLTGKASPGRKASATSGLSGIQVSAGTIMSQVLNNTNSFIQAGEPNHCGSLGGSSRWLILRPTTDSLELLIDTVGSAIDTILAVYSSQTIIGTRVEVACNHGTGGPAIVTFPASSTLYYWVVVDGLNGAQGLIQLNWRLGRSPGSGPDPLDQSAPVGGDVFWSASPGGAYPAPSYQWYQNGFQLEEATSQTLHLRPLLPEHAGVYTVVLSNLMGVTTQLAGRLTVDYSLTTAVRSDFDSGPEDWMVLEDGVPGTPSHVLADPHAGGYISAGGTSAGLWFFLAPGKFLGNQSGSYGGRLEFDLYLTETPQTMDGPEVILWCGRRQLFWDSPSTPESGWTHFQVPLHETAGWRITTPAGPEPTRDQMLSALSDVVQWAIRGHYSGAAQNNGLDNVALVFPVQNQVTLLKAWPYSQSQILLEWPENAAGFQLESSQSLNPASWKPLANIPTSQNALRRLILEASPDKSFFRLRKP